MRKAVKFGITCLLAVMSISAVCITFASNQPHLVEAAQCSHQGNYYDCVEATASESGIHEYWVCCKCHQHYLSKPNSGKWTNAGEAYITIDKNDDRYTAPGHLSNGIVLSADGKSITSYTPVDGITDAIIPEGVETIADGVFNGSDITSVSLPSTLKDIGQEAFANCESLHSIVIPESVTEIAYHAFFDDDYSVVGYNNPNDIVVYLNISQRDANKQFDDGWDEAYRQWNVLYTSTKNITVYYKGQWHYDANGNPTPGK